MFWLTLLWEQSLAKEEEKVEELEIRVQKMKEEQQISRKQMDEKLAEQEIQHRELQQQMQVCFVNNVLISDTVLLLNFVFSLKNLNVNKALT